MAVEIDMYVAGVGIHPEARSPVIVLRDLDKRMVLPIWIGLLEAERITAIFHGIVFPRPTTYDLFKDLFVLMTENGVETRFEKVVINDIKDSVFHALLYISVNGREVAIDARPSDAIAIALQTKSPIFALDGVLAQAGISAEEEGSGGGGEIPPDTDPSPTIH